MQRISAQRTDVSEKAGASETCKTTRRYRPEDLHLNIHSRENGIPNYCPLYCRYDTPVASTSTQLLTVHCTADTTHL
jgi:hypothetical protein